MWNCRLFRRCGCLPETHQRTKKAGVPWLRQLGSCPSQRRLIGVQKERKSKLLPESIGVTKNDPALTRRLAGAFNGWFGKEGAKTTDPVMGAEDFSEFSRDGVPACMWRVGATAPERFAEAERTGIPVPSNHSATFAPVPEPTLKACVTSMTAAVLELMPPAPAGGGPGK